MAIISGVPFYPPAGMVTSPGKTWNGSSWSPPLSFGDSVTGVGALEGAYYEWGPSASVAGRWHIPDSALPGSGNYSAPNSWQPATRGAMVRSSGGGGGLDLFGGGSDGGGGSGGFNLGTLLAQQQVATAISSLFTANQSLMVAQTTAPTKGPFAAAILQGMSLGLGQSGGASSAGAGNSQTAMLITLLGANTFTSLVTALNAYNAVLGNSAATFTTIANAHNTFLSALQSILSTISNNNLIASLGSGEGEGGTGALLTVMLQNTANTAFVSANPQVAVPLTTTTMDSAFSTLESSFLAWLNSATTNAMMAALLR